MESRCVYVCVRERDSKKTEIIDSKWIVEIIHKMAPRTNENTTPVHFSLKRSPSLSLFLSYFNCHNLICRVSKSKTVCIHYCQLKTKDQHMCIDSQTDGQIDRHIRTHRQKESERDHSPQCMKCILKRANKRTFVYVYSLVWQINSGHFFGKKENKRLYSLTQPYHTHHKPTTAIIFHHSVFCSFFPTTIKKRFFLFFDLRTIRMVRWGFFRSFDRKRRKFSFTHIENLAAAHTSLTT